jgi:predicted Zn-dependent protease
VNFSGCSGLSTNFNTATDEQETTMYSTDREQQIGAAMAQEMEKEYKVVDDVAMNERVDRISEKLSKACDRKELVYITKVIEEKKPTGEGPMVNAVSLPGGYVYVFKGLMDYIKDDAQLAAVIGHEIGHIAARHSVKRMQASYGSLIAVVAAIQANGALGAGMAAAVESMFMQYSQEDELQADGLGIKYMKAAGYDPHGMVTMLGKLGEYDSKQPIRPKIYWRTHPYVHQRIAAANRIITGDLSFRDYVRITGEGNDFKK